MIIIIQITAVQYRYFVFSASGEIILKTSAPDYETIGSSYAVDLCVEDTANPTKRKVCQTLNVAVTDVNDEL